MRIWFDLAEADVVLSDQRAVRKSIAAGFRHMFLWAFARSYIVAALVAAIILAGGLDVDEFVSPRASAAHS